MIWSAENILSIMFILSKIDSRLIWRTECETEITGSWQGSSTRAATLLNLAKTRVCQVLRNRRRSDIRPLRTWSAFSGR